MGKLKQYSEETGWSRRKFLQATATVSGAMLFPFASQSKSVLDNFATPQVNDWNITDIPSQQDKVIIITGGTGSPIGDYSGLGYQTALALAAKDATVIIASRSEPRGEEAIQVITGKYPNAKIQFEYLDLSKPETIKAFSEKIKSNYSSIDTLVNNAGFAGYLHRTVNSKNIEKCFATNVVGHFSLTAHLLPLLKKAKDPRVVFLSSSAAGGGNIDFDDLQTEKDYTFLKAYSKTKFAVQMLAYEMQRRSEANNWGVKIIPVHPGVALTFLIPNGPGPDSDWGRMIASNPQMFKPAAQGCLSTLYAATRTDAKGGNYYGVDANGIVKSEIPTQGTDDSSNAKKLWNAVSELAEITI